MRVARLFSRLAVLGSLALLLAIVPSAGADETLVSSFWPFKKSKDKECEPPSCVVPAPCLVPSEVKPVEPDKKEPEKKAEEKLPPPIIPPLTEAPEMGPALGAAGFSIASSNVGYIDSAIPFTGLRFRYDSAYDLTHPNRAEYFYAKYRSIGGNGVAFAETRVDYQEFRTALEYAWARRFSTFIEMPVRLINPELNNNAAGWGDLNFGGKFAAIADDTTFLTFQMRTYVPTGPGARGLGTNHVSLEPGLLFWKRVGDRLLLEGGFQDWIPINGSDYAGNVLQYGLGASYAVYQSCKCRVSPVVEFVGWTVLAGKDTDFILGPITTATAGQQQGGGTAVGGLGAVGTFNNPARGDTIVNVKGGVRVDIANQWSIYAGYGHALTGATWYKDLFRFELRWAF
jgi:hypothetical protein